jgi:DNA-binding transcriptional MocR family regulator
MGDKRIGFSIIPNEVKYAANLKPLAKFILSDIVSFTYAFECFASNDYFAELYGVTSRTVERVMSELRASGYIETHYNASTNKRTIIPSVQIMRSFLRVRETDIMIEEKKHTQEQKEQYNEQVNQTKKGVDLSSLKKIWT